MADNNDFLEQYESKFDPNNKEKINPICVSLNKSDYKLSEKPASTAKKDFVNPYIQVNAPAVVAEQNESLASQAADAYLAVRLEADEFAGSLHPGEYVIWKDRPKFGTSVIKKLIKEFFKTFFLVSILTGIIITEDVSISDLSTRYIGFPALLGIISAAVTATVIMRQLMTQRYAITNERVLLFTGRTVKSEALEQVYDAQKHFKGTELFDISFKTHRFPQKDNLGVKCTFYSVSDGDGARIINTLSNYRKKNP